MPIIEYIVALNEPERYTTFSVSVCVCIYVSRGVRRDLMPRSRMGRKSRISRDLSPPSPSQQLRLTIEWRFWKKKSLLLYFIVKNAGFFHQPTLTRAKGSHHQCVRGWNLQGMRTMWKMEVRNGKRTKLPVLFQYCFLLTQWAMWIALCMCVCLRSSTKLPSSRASHRSYLNLQNALVASRCNGGLLKLLELGIFHIQ